jgi:ribulose-phosphate 3-epimerase
MRLAPSLLSADFARLAEAIRESEKGGADALHLDVMDGHFVPNLSFGPALVRAVRGVTHLPLDVHLMVARPDRFVEPFANAGGTTLVFHRESDAEPGDVIRRIHDLGLAAGIAVRPSTALDAIEPWVDRVEQLLVMSVQPGFSGQAFLPESVGKLATARATLDRIGSPADLSVDGGVNRETAALAARAGATFFVCGDSVFARGSVVDNLKALRTSIEGGRP